ncbi:MAG: histidinol dehydrogenase [Phycisphaerales bacterium]
MTLRMLNMATADDRATLEQLLARLRDQSAATGDMASTVAAILEDVRRHGDEAVARYMRQWTDPAFSPDRIRVLPDELKAAERGLDPQVRDALVAAIEHVRTYQTHIMPADPKTLSLDGAALGLRWTPIRRVGAHAPGGRAAYPSTVMMTVVPAQVAGVKEIAVVCPPPTAGASTSGSTSGGDVSPLVLATCHLLGVTEVYRIGGAQAIAALAFGTATVRPVDFIAGPGNAFVQQAKRQVFGTVGIDGFYGPSEVVILADDSADPAMIAADLLAQAEHDPGSCFLISTSAKIIERINAQIVTQLPGLGRRDVIAQSLRDWSAAILAGDENEAMKLVDTFAAEHVTLAVSKPHDTLKKLRNGGAFFLGDRTPVASGDYYAGPSHCLPTGTTARFTSGISAYTFLKRSSVEHYPQGPDARTIDHIAVLAEAEGLDAHAASVRARRN